MEPNIILELIGYIGTALVVISMMMKSINKLRILNICGSIVSSIYSAICGAWPIVLMNLSLIAINLFHLIHDKIKNNKAEQGTSGTSDINSVTVE